MFETLLIANRGEIACRIIKSAKALGINTVAVYSTPDQTAPHVMAANKAVHIGSAASQDSYLNVDAIIKAAHSTGANAIHPGYGFLSESVELAKACKENNILFVGPSIKAIQIMGAKDIAKQTMESAKVPVVPGYHGGEQGDQKLLAHAKTIGFPVLLKASAGGGGKGMRAVHDEASFFSALEGAKREAKASFNDDTILIEKLISSPRHIEVQIFADTHGHVVHLFDRDCSVQRRHQKIIEEAPAPNIPQTIRDSMASAAINAAKAIDYYGAGTVEFLLAEDGQFYFMEMNTRLQVEHPVTEMITGIDLVHWQLLVANGQPLPYQQEQIKKSGHAMEVRLYAEDPDNDFLPASGTITTLLFPNNSSSVRIDSGIKENDNVSVFYDPMLAKLISYGEDREQARRKLYTAIRQTRLIGIKNNLDFLARIIESTPFKSADLSTNFLTQHKEKLHKNQAPLLMYFAALYLAQPDKDAHSLSPWQTSNAYRNNLDNIRTFNLLDDESEHQLNLRLIEPGHYEISLQKQVQIKAKVVKLAQHLMLEINGEHYQCHIFYSEKTQTIDVYTDSNHQQFSYPLTTKIDASSDSTNELTAPLPGTVVAVNVSPSQQVRKGESLMVIEAMKMEHSIYAPNDGKIEAIYFSEGEQVMEGEQLVSIN